MEKRTLGYRSWLGRGAMALFFITGMTLALAQPCGAKTGNPAPPAKPVKLVFIHHSVGENWLSDEQGGLGRALAGNNYFVSDTNYGWGPNGIGDRTDIVNWPEWFTGPESGGYLRELYRESGKHSPYTRSTSDPGGENRIVIFKSCFPNSNLEGGPADRPKRGEGLTVSNAKAIYNELLDYFATRPDKLFVVITAPPVQDPARAANARAFNTWLVRDWLSGYKGDNVAVFDFYNVLTAPENHHRIRDGAIEYVTDRGGNTLYYPTDGDNHPSPAGSRKATGEFVPLLNAFYNRWRKGAPVAPAPPKKRARGPRRPAPAATRPAVEEKTPEPEQPSPSAPASGVIDNFETGADQWAVFKEEGKDTRLAFAQDKGVSYSGTAGMRIEYDISPGSWAACSLVYPSPQDWRGRKGLAVYVRAGRAGQPVTVIAYQGETTDNLSHFEFRTLTNREAVSGWQRIDIPWSKLVQASWEGDGAASFDPGRAMGMAFGFNAPPGARNDGTLWVDDISFLSAVPPPQ